ALMERSLVLFTRIGDDAGRAECPLYWSDMSRGGITEEQLRMCESALALFTRLNRSRDVARAMERPGVFRIVGSRWHEARALLLGALARFQEGKHLVDTARLIAKSLVRLHEELTIEGIKGLLEQQLPIVDETGSLHLWRDVTWGLARLEAREGSLARS